MPLTEPPTISIIVPVYRVEEYLCRCVDSLLDQTFQVSFRLPDLVVLREQFQSLSGVINRSLLQVRQDPGTYQIQPCLKVHIADLQGMYGWLYRFLWQIIDDGQAVGNGGFRSFR